MTIKQMLNQNIPESAVEKRSGGGGKELSYLTGAYVINRLNEVLGQGNWGYSITELSKTFEGKLVQGFKKEVVFATSYLAQLVLTSKIDGVTTHFEEIGYGDGTDKTNPGKAHELATKEAITDALKRAAKNLGISMGLGLYFKSGEYVDEQAVQTKPETRPVVTKTIPSPTATVSKTTNTQPVAAKVQENSSVLPSESTAPFTDTKILRAKIKSAFAVLEAQKKVSKTEFVTNYLAGGKVDTISNEQVNKTLDMLKNNFKELGL